MAIISKRIDTSSGSGEAFKQNGHQSLSLIEDCSDILALLSAEGTVIYVSPSIASALGYAPEEIVGYPVSVLIHPDDLDTLQQVLGEIAQIPGKSLSAEYRLHSKDGSWRWFEGSTTNLLRVPGTEAIVGNFRDITRQKLAPRLQRSKMNASEHFVQFYETDEFLLDALSSFIGTGLRTGEACIVVATQAHREGLEQRLKASGLDLAAAHSRDEYIALDAGETLAKFMVDGSPEPELFASVIGSIIQRATKGRRRVRIFGEMVALLWMEGNRSAAIRLEELWNDLPYKTGPFSLFCAYRMRGFAGEVYGEQFSEICKLHAHILPDESYSALTTLDERLRAISLLQQKASSLEAEIAERKKTEEALLYLAAIVESSDDAIFSKDLEGIITSWNVGAERMFGYSAQEIVGRPVSILFPPDEPDEFTHIMERIRRGERIDHYDTRRMRKDGSLLYASVTVSPIRDSTGTIIGASDITRDISERKELDKRKDEFISMASHELKTPVTSLKGFLSLLQRHLTTRKDEKALYYLTRMNAQINKLTMLIGDLLDLSRIQTGKIAYREERFALDALVQEIVENVQETTQTHRLLLQGQTQAEVFGDRDRIGQVLINLLNNAIKYSPQADRVLVRLTKDEHNALVSIQDFGIGIGKEHQQKIFERFYQVSDHEGKTYPGLGIGLYLSGEIVKRHGGQMWVESEQGKGATFHFTVPLVG